MHFTKLRFKKASISKCLSLKPERLGFEMSLPVLKSLSTAAIVGKEVLYYTNSFFSTALAVVALGMCKVCKCTGAPHFWGAPHLTYREQKKFDYEKL